MKTVYLIAAHYGPEQFGELVRSLKSRRVVVHIDKKSEESQFRTAVQELPVDFVPEHERVDVSWGGWSQVESTLAMMRVASRHISEEDYVVLLSGDSYPLQAPDRIEDFLENGAGAQYMNSVRMPSKVVTKPLSRITRLYVEYNPRSGEKNYVPKFVNRLGIPRSYHKAFASRTPYAGSTWWAFTGEACKWILTEVERDPAFPRYCRRTKMPDEFFFQTLIENSPFKANIRRSLMFTDWSRPTGPKPSVLDQQHIGDLLANNLVMDDIGYGRGIALFGRKVQDPIIAGEIRKQLWPLTITHAD